MSSVSNKITAVKKKLSALAQLVALYAKHEGITETVELVALTGYTDRAIRMAKAEAGFLGSPLPTPRKPASAPRNPGSVGTLPATRTRIRNHPTDDSYPKSSSKLSEDSLSEGVTSPACRPESKQADNPNDPEAIVWHGQALRVTRRQLNDWARMFRGYDLDHGLPIADAECAEKGKRNGEAVIYAQKKLGYLASDMAIALSKGLDPDEAKERRIEAALRALNPNFTGRA